MSAQIEWIKKSIGLCAKVSDDVENEIRAEFRKLEIQYHQFTAEQRENIKDIIEANFEINDTIFILSCFTRYMRNDEFWKDILAVILRGEFDCYIGAMLENQLSGHILGSYKEKRILHKRNVDGFAKALGASFEYVPVEERHKKRIVIITEQILDEFHAPTKIVLDFAYVLQEYLGYEVYVYVCPCDGYIPEALWRDAIGKRTLEKYRDKTVTLDHRGAGIRCSHINMQPLQPEKYRKMLTEIYNFKPLFVLNMGVCNPVADLPGRFTSLAAMEMTIEGPISEGEILVRIDKRSGELEQAYAKSLGKEQIQLYMDTKIPVLERESKNKYTRAELGLPEEDFLIAIVGNRLDTEIDRSFIRVMQRIMERTDRAAFVIIGEVHDIKEDLKKEVFENRVYYMGFQSDLLGVYGILDLYLNPKRGGGGFSSMMALVAKVPVVTLPDCDVAYNVGEEFIVSDYEKMIDIVCRYKEDRGFYTMKKLDTEIISDQNTDEKMIQYVSKMVGGISDIVEEKIKELC